MSKTSTADLIRALAEKNQQSERYEQAKAAVTKAQEKAEKK